MSPASSNCSACDALATTITDDVSIHACDDFLAVNSPHLVALVRAGATFCNGKLVERAADQDAEVMIA